MPHDVNGTKIDEGDLVVAKHWLHGNRPTACLVLGVNEGSTTCNINAQSVHAPHSQANCVTATDCEVLLKRDGTRPAIKPQEQPAQPPEAGPA